MTVITLKVKGYFKTSEFEISPETTVLECKKVVSRAQRIPVSAQTYFFCGNKLDNSNRIIDVGVKNGSTITMTVLTQYVECVHPFRFRCPLTGKLVADPIECTDRYIYDGDVLNMWTESLRGQALISPMTREIMRRRGTDSALLREIDNYIENFDVMKPAEHLSLDRLGRLQTILGHLSHVVGPIPRNAIPHIVSIGGESIGKSVTLESITMMPIFPFGANRCTRMPVEIRFRRGPTQLPVFRVIRGSGANTDLDEAEENTRENGPDCLCYQVMAVQAGRGQMQQQMSEIMDQISRRFNNPDEAPGICTDRYMVVDLVGESYPDLNVTDFPGLASNDVEIIQEMMRNHFRRHGNKSIYLHMTKAAQFTEDGPFQILEEALLERTIALVTHADMADSIPDHPDRLGQLQDLCKGVVTSEASALGDRVFTNGTFMAMNKQDDELDPPGGYEPIYNRRARAKIHFASTRWTNAGMVDASVDGLIKKMHQMYFLSLEESYIPHALSSIQAHEAEQHRRNVELGLPAMADAFQLKEQRDLLVEVTNGIINTLQDNLPRILLDFDKGHIQPLEEELAAVLSSPDYELLGRLHVHDVIAETGQAIMTIFESHIESHMEFWLGEFERSLVEDSSEMKLGRFTDAIRACKDHLRAKLEVVFGRIDENVISFWTKEARNVQVSSVRGIDEEADDAVPMVKLVFNTHSETLAHIMCDSMREFSDIISNPAELETCMEDCQLIEDCLDERMTIRNELLLCRLAKVDVLKLAYRFNSTKSLLCPGLMVGLLHPKTKSILQVVRSAEQGGELVVQAKPCGDEFAMDNCCEITGQKWEQFEVVDVGNGEVGFRCPAFPDQYLCSSADGSLKTMASEDGDGFGDVLRFKARFHSEASSSNSFPASRVVTLSSKGSGGFLKVTSHVSQSQTACVVDSAPSDMSADKMDEMFVVVSNPEIYF